MPIPQSQVTLKSYFETGDIPTQAQFAELIDTMFFLVNQAKAQADAAVATANAALAAVTGKTALAAWRGTYTAGVPSTVATLSSLNVASAAMVGGFIRITFTAALANANYRVLVLPGSFVLSTANVAFVDIGPGSSGTVPVSLLVI